MKKIILLTIFLIPGIWSYAQTINAEQIKKDNFTIRGNVLHQLTADTNRIATRRYVDSILTTSTFDTTAIYNALDLKVDSVKRVPGTDSVLYYTNGTPHFGFIDSVSAATIGGMAWALTGNAGTTAGTNFIGTTDSVAWVWKTNNIEWARLRQTGQLKLMSGYNTYFEDTSLANSDNVLTNNLFIGDSAGFTAIYSPLDTAAPHNNVGIGRRALANIRVAWNNTAVGTAAGQYLTGRWGDASHNPGTPYGSGYENSFFGALSGGLCDSCYENTFIGTKAGYHCIGCKDNVFVGVGAGQHNRANSNTFIGTFCGQSNTTGFGNVFVGAASGNFNTSGNQNAFFGGGAGEANTSGFSNTFLGEGTGALNTTGAGSIYIGIQAGKGCTTGSENIAIGELCLDNLTTQSNWNAIGKGYVQGTFTGDTTHTWIIGQDFQSTSTNRVRFNGQTIFAKGINFTEMSVNTTAGDGATINAVTGSFRKDATGSSFTLTNSYISANSKLILTVETAGITAGRELAYSCGGGSATITFESAGVATQPSGNVDVTFLVLNP